MATKDITDEMVCRAYADARMYDMWPTDILMKETGQCEKVCRCAIERAFDRGLLECGVSERSGWLTDAGKALLGKGTV